MHVEIYENSIKIYKSRTNKVTGTIVNVLEIGWEKKEWVENPDIVPEIATAIFFACKSSKQFKEFLKIYKSK